MSNPHSFFSPIFWKNWCKSISPLHLFLQSVCRYDTRMQRVNCLSPNVTNVVHIQFFETVSGLFSQLYTLHFLLTLSQRDISGLRSTLGKTFGYYDYFFKLRVSRYELIQYVSLMFILQFHFKNFAKISKIWNLCYLKNLIYPEPSHTDNSKEEWRPDFKPKGRACQGLSAIKMYAALIVAPISVPEVGIPWSNPNFLWPGGVTGYKTDTCGDSLRQIKPRGLQISRHSGVNWRNRCEP